MFLNIELQTGQQARASLRTGHWGPSSELRHWALGRAPGTGHWAGHTHTRTLGGLLSAVIHSRASPRHVITICHNILRLHNNPSR